jgi:putative CocE/NonD family hydrolase
MSQKLLDTKLITPVDSDPEGVIVAQVRAERHGESTADIATKMEKVPYRDSLIPSEGENLWIDHQALYPLMDKINRSGVPVYLINGWYDIYARDNFLIYTNLTTPKRLMVRPTDHSNVEDAGADIAIGVEAHRWFDYWLKGIDNGIMSEPPIHYYVMNGDKSSAWHTTDTWPLPEQSVTRYYFAPALSSAANATSGSQVSANNGGLMMEAPASSPTSASAADAYTIDYTTTTGTRARWTSVEEPHKYPNMRAHDAKALTYTTPPLESALDVTGHPLVHLWLCADAGSPRNLDLDAFVYLEEVDRAGNVTYITEGLLRASHRALSPAPFASFGLPFHTHFQTDLLPVQPGEPFELVFDLLPTAYRFSPGKQLRISLAFADADNFTTPIFTPAPKVQLLHNQSHPSYMEVPVVK